MKGSGPAFRSVVARIAGFRDTATTALSFDGQQISYAELHLRSGKFAQHLARLGVVGECTVALCMERSFDWIVAALGILRAGAAYVPLDDAWPELRLKFAIEDSEARVLVGRAALLDRLDLRIPGVDPFRDRAAIALARTPPEPFHIADVDANRLAYVIYTSGSSGRPKGVEITHGNLCHLIDWHQGAFGITSGYRTSHLAGLGFDASAWELWPNLSAGATICLADEASRSSAERTRQWMLRERITVGFVPTFHAAAMMTMAWPTATSLRFLLTGGDTLLHGPQTPLPFQVINNYGPTECTVVATSSTLEPYAQGLPPIGHPIAGGTIYLLDEHGSPVDEGEIGEIWLGGAGVGRGYRNLPALTARSFVADPFAPGSEQCSNRMYRTGDRGARRYDGEIEFRGRLDRQVKIRGQRVELDEIGHTLGQMPGVEFAAALVNVSDTGETRLVAYVLPQQQMSEPTVQELQRYLLDRLPAYMLPERFFRLTSLPASPNGKLDLSLVPLPDGALLLQPGRSLCTQGHSKIQEKLLTMVGEIIKEKAIRPEDNFFLEGGHSLFAMQLIVRIRAVFDEELSLQRLFEMPTVKSLASWIETRQMENRAATMPAGVLALNPEGTRQSLFWVHTANLDLARELGEDQPFFLVTLTSVDLFVLGKSPPLQAIASLFMRKILEAQPKGPFTIGGVCAGSVLAFEIASQMQAAGHNVSHLLLLDAPTQPYLGSCHRLRFKLSHPGYLVSGVSRLGLRKSLINLHHRFQRRIAPATVSPVFEAEKSVAHRMIEAAVFAYHPKLYVGRVLLLLARERASILNFLPGWRSVVPHDLCSHFVKGRHRRIITPPERGKYSPPYLRLPGIQFNAAIATTGGLFSTHADCSRKRVHLRKLKLNYCLPRSSPASCFISSAMYS